MTEDKERGGDGHIVPVHRVLADELADDIAEGFEVPILDSNAQRSYIESLEAQVESLSRMLERRTAEANAAALHAAEAAADVDRAAERIGRESQRQVTERVRKILASFLEVIDDIDRALAAAQQGAAPETLLDGVSLIRRSFMTRLEQQGVTKCESLGRKFDPLSHEAITVVATTNPAEDGVVVAVLREGYLLGDAVLRPAAVAVGRAT